MNKIPINKCYFDGWIIEEPYFFTNKVGVDQCGFNIDVSNNDKPNILRIHSYDRQAREIKEMSLKKNDFVKVKSYIHSRASHDGSNIKYDYNLCAINIKLIG